MLRYLVQTTLHSLQIPGLTLAHRCAAHSQKSRICRSIHKTRSYFRV